MAERTMRQISGGSMTGCASGAFIAITVSLMLWALIAACVAAVWDAAT